MMPLLKKVKGRYQGLLKEELAAQKRRARDAAPPGHGWLRAGTAHRTVIAEFSTPLS